MKRVHVVSLCSKSVEMWTVALGVSVSMGRIPETAESLGKVVNRVIAECVSAVPAPDLVVLDVRVDDAVGVPVHVDSFIPAYPVCVAAGVTVLCLTPIQWGQCNGCSRACQCHTPEDVEGSILNRIGETMGAVLVAEGAALRPVPFSDQYWFEDGLSSERTEKPLRDGRIYPVVPG